MRARLLFRDKKILANGAIVEMVIWQLPAASADRPHGYKYRPYYGKGGRRLVGYDNERSKGDHKHVGQREERYQFVSIDQLIEDFLTDIERVEAKQCAK